MTAGLDCSALSRAQDWSSSMVIFLQRSYSKLFWNSILTQSRFSQINPWLQKQKCQFSAVSKKPVTSLYGTILPALLTPTIHSCPLDLCLFVFVYSLWTGSCPRFVTGKYCISPSSRRVDSNIVSFKRSLLELHVNNTCRRYPGLCYSVLCFPTSPIKRTDARQMGIRKYLHHSLHSFHVCNNVHTDGESAGIIFFFHLSLSQTAIGDYYCSGRSGLSVGGKCHVNHTEVIMTMSLNCVLYPGSKQRMLSHCCVSETSRITQASPVWERWN